MLSLMYVFITSVILVLVFYLGCFILSWKDYYESKLSSLECGFVNVVGIQHSFSVHFFVVMLMFVIFDLEVVMFLGLLLVSNYSLLSFFLLFIFIAGGFYMEWFYSKLTWII